MKFGFDNNDMLIDLRKHAFTIYNQKLGKNVPLDQFTNLERVEIHELFDLTDEQDGEKIEIIRRLGLDYYFDDKPDVVNTLLKEENLKVILKDQSYNRHLTFTRLVDWTDIQQILEKKQV